MSVRLIDDLNAQELRELFGERDECLFYLSDKFTVNITAFDGVLTIKGEDNNCDKVVNVINILRDMIRRGDKIKVKDVRFAIEIVDKGQSDNYAEMFRTVITTSRGRQVRAKTYGQAEYITAIEHNSIVIAEGPAGTGKTYLAVCLAVRALKDKQVDRIILTRPAVEAGEKLGFLPGDLGAKVDPYLRPLYDALQEMFGLESYSKLIERGIIEIAPLAYMRGRTLSSAFIILDEAQNSTREQMKMLLTRMGEGSKIVVTGDLTQIDLPSKRSSGLMQAVEVLQNIPEISIVRMTSNDVVRHELVMRIVNAYEHAEKEQDDKKPKIL